MVLARPLALLFCIASFSGCDRLQAWLHPPPPSKVPPRLPDPPSDASELYLLAGRSLKKPPQGYWRATMTVGQKDATHRFRVETRGCAGDPAILLSLLGADSNEPIATLFNDDGSSTNDGPIGRDSHIDGGARSGRVRYEVIVFSQQTTPAFCSIWYQLDDDMWTFWAQDYVGGRVIEVGPLADGDFVKAVARSARARLEPVRMILFDLGAGGTCTGTRGAICTARNPPIQASSEEGDPRIPSLRSPLPGDWRAPVRSFVLLGPSPRGPEAKGKEEDPAPSREAATPPGVISTRLREGTSTDEVILGPRERIRSAPVTLLRGRYRVWVYARPMPFSYPGNARCVDCADAKRSFDLSLEVYDAARNGWTVRQHRRVHPRELGSSAEWTRLLLDETPAQAAPFRVVVQVAAKQRAAYSFYYLWRAQRIADPGKETTVTLRAAPEPPKHP